MKGFLIEFFDFSDIYLIIFLLLYRKNMIMKKFEIIIVALLIITTTSDLVAQLYVGNSSYVFNKGALVYVKGTIELNTATSNFYLRNEGQLLQGTTIGSTNKGIGKLSVFRKEL